MADDGSDAELRGRDLIGLGGLLAGSVIAFTLLGLVVDDAADSSPAFTLVGVGLGIVARRGRLLAPRPRPRFEVEAR